MHALHHTRTDEKHAYDSMMTAFDYVQLRLTTFDYVQLRLATFDYVQLRSITFSCVRLRFIRRSLSKAMSIASSRRVVNREAFPERVAEVPQSRLWIWTFLSLCPAA